MNNVLRMVRLDFSLIKPYLKSLLIVLFVPVLVIYSTRNVISGLVFFMSIISMTSSYTFSIAEKNDLNRLYGLLPVTKREIVLGRYTFIALTGAVAALIGVALNVIILMLTNSPFTYAESVVAVSTGMMLYTFFTALQVPVFFKFGALKGRIINFIPVVGMFSVGIIAEGVSPESVQKLPDIAFLNSTPALFAVSILLDIIIYSISMGITKKLYEKMEL